MPSEAADVAAESFTELGLVGLIVAGEMWVHTRGWANLYRKQELLPEHRFPASAISMLVTATAVLRLVADGRVGLDEPANRYLRAIRLAGGAVTVRELLSHTDGVDDPEARFADRVPDLVSVTGRIASASGGRRCCPARWPARR